MRRPTLPAKSWKRSRLTRLLAISLAIAATASLSGCAQDIAGTVPQMCQDWREIGVRKADQIGPDTSREIVGNNVARDVWCKPKGGSA